MREVPDARVHPDSLPVFVQASQFPASAHGDLLDAWDIALQMATGRETGTGSCVLAGGALESPLDLAAAHGQREQATGGDHGNRYRI
jgi:hypothetical protein